MKNIINILIISILSINLSFSQTLGAANQNSGTTVAISGQITYASLAGFGTNGYVVPITGNVHFTKIKEDLGASIKISVYPNPSKGIVNLFLRQKTEINSLKIKIINTQGCVIKDFSDLAQITGRTAKARINLTDLSNGVYFLNIEINNKSALTYKLIKN